MKYQSFIHELQRLEDIETEFYQTHPSPGIITDSEEAEYLREIDEQRSYIVKIMASCLGILPRSF